MLCRTKLQRKGDLQEPKSLLVLHPPPPPPTLHTHTHSSAFAIALGWFNTRPTLREMKAVSSLTCFFSSSMPVSRTVVLPQCRCCAWTCIQFDFWTFVHIRIHMFVYKWGFQVPHRNVSLSDEWRHLVEGVIIRVVAMLNVIFYRARKGNITHKQQSDSFYKRKIRDSICRL